MPERAEGDVRSASSRVWKDPLTAAQDRSAPTRKRTIVHRGVRRPEIPTSGRSALTGDSLKAVVNLAERERRGCAYRGKRLAFILAERGCSRLLNGATREGIANGAGTLSADRLHGCLLR